MRWGSEEWKNVRDVRLRTWLLGDDDALNFLVTISNITEVWDDLIDGDKPVTAGQVNGAFFDALVNLSNNPFYVKYRERLTPIIIQSINSWLDANDLEKGGSNQRALAYTLRNMDIQLLQFIVYLVGGFEHMRSVSREIWDFFGADQDDAITWIMEKVQ